MTKSELEYYRDKIENRKGIYGNPQESAWISMELSNIKELIEEAPETVEKRVYSTRIYLCADVGIPICKSWGAGRGNRKKRPFLCSVRGHRRTDRGGTKRRWQR